MISRSRCLLGALAALALLPAAARADAPANDNRADAAALTAGADVQGTTVGATREANDPPSCPRDGGATVWYRYHAPTDGSARFALTTHGGLDATLAVYRVDESTITRIGCQDTARGRLLAETDLDTGDFLIRVSEQKGSASGSFRLQFSGVLTEPTPPGKLLGGSGQASGSVDGLTHPFVQRSRALLVGHDYRVRVDVAGGRCDTQATLVDPHGDRRFLGCQAYTVITPRPGQGGRWTIALNSDAVTAEHYRLAIVPVAGDDLAPGTFIGAFGRANGVVSGSGPDAQDVYRFDVTKRAEITLRLHSAGAMRLRLRTERGHPVTSASVDGGTGQLRTRLRPGRFYVIVDASQSAGGRYTLSRLTRVITATTVGWNGNGSAQKAPGSSSTVDVTVAGADRGRATVMLERFDPQFGWRFWFRRTIGISGGHGSFSVDTATIGRYRVRAAYAGSRDASPSHSRRAAYLRVVAPLRQ